MLVIKCMIYCKYLCYMFIIKFASFVYMCDLCTRAHTHTQQVCTQKPEEDTGCAVSIPTILGIQVDT